MTHMHSTQTQKCAKRYSKKKKVKVVKNKARAKKQQKEPSRKNRIKVIMSV